MSSELYVPPQTLPSFPSTTHIRFRRAQLELDDSNLGLLNPRGSASRSDDVLVQKDTVHEFGVVDGTADLLDEADVAKVDVGGGRGNEAENRVDGDGGEDGGVLGDNL